MKDYKDIALPPGFGWVDMSSPAYRQAAGLAMDPDEKCTAVMGPGGSGKSVLYRMAWNALPGRTLCTATTGVAAFNLQCEGVPASTLHSALKIKPQAWYDPGAPLSARTVRMLQGVDTLLVDEVSMMSCNLLDFVLRHVDAVNRSAARRSCPIKIVLFGDVMQLPPVLDSGDDTLKRLYDAEYGGKRFFFSSNLYRKRIRRTVELYDVYRQDDGRFRDMLSGIRIGAPSDEALEEINRHVAGEEEFAATVGREGMMHLAGTNASVRSLNGRYEQRFAASGARGMRFDADFEDNASAKDFPIVPESMTLYVGEQVMCLANKKDEYQNGTIGTVVDFQNGLPVVRGRDGSVFTVTRFAWDRIVTALKDGAAVNVKTGSMKQVACKPAYAVTFHKAQGLTLDACYMDFSGWIAPGSAYLGLSRLRTLGGLGLRAPLRRSMVKTDPEALEFFAGGIDAIPGELGLEY